MFVDLLWSPNVYLDLNSTCTYNHIGPAEIKKKVSSKPVSFLFI